MADTWQEYFEGSPEQRLADLEYQRAQIEAAKNSPKYKQMRRLVMQDTGDYDFDPREGLWSFPTPDGLQVRDQFEPRRTTDFGDDMAYGANYALAMGQRMRDTGLRGVQELSAGNPLKALELGARAVPSAVFPSLASGTPGSPDDWRERARKNGVSEASIMAFDFGTDPEMWLAAPVAGPAAFVVPALPFAAAKTAGRIGSRADDILRSMGRSLDSARYGAGARADLVDEAGDVIRRLRNAPRAEQMRIEYVR